MGEKIVTVTEAARHLADCVNRAHYQNETFVLLKNGIPFARLIPAGRPVCRGSDLAEALASVEIADEEARAWNRDLRAAREELEGPTDRWQASPQP